MEGQHFKVELNDLFSISTQDLYFQRPNTKENDRFAKPLTEEEIVLRNQDRIPQGTKKQNSWAFSVWKNWAVHRNGLHITMVDKYFPVMDLGSGHFPAETLNYWLCHFVQEIKRKDRSDYPARTLYQIICGIMTPINDPLSV